MPNDPSEIMQACEAALAELPDDAARSRAVNHLWTSHDTDPPPREKWEGIVMARLAKMSPTEWEVEAKIGRALEPLAWTSIERVHIVTELYLEHYQPTPEEQDEREREADRSAVKVRLDENQFRDLVAGRMVIAANGNGGRRKARIILADIGWERIKAAIAHAEREQG